MLLQPVSIILLRMLVLQGVLLLYFCYFDFASSSPAVTTIVGVFDPSRSHPYPLESTSKYRRVCQGPHSHGIIRLAKPHTSNDTGPCALRCPHLRPIISFAPFVPARSVPLSFPLHSCSSSISPLEIVPITDNSKEHARSMLARAPTASATHTHTRCIP